MTALYPVILSGGAGTRLWPLSREMYPKQLLALTGKQTMLQDTALRLAGIPGAKAPIVVCNEAHRFTVAEQLRTLGQEAAGILLEPAGRNTAPAVALAALKAHALDPESTLVVAPADHVIRDARTFQAAAETAARLAQDGKLVTFGIVAHAPETGYGYIRRGEGAGPAYPVAQFIEKPPLDVAAQFVASGDYYWNSGMFVFKAGRYLAELEAFAPDILAASRAAYAAAKTDLDFVRIDAAEFARCRSESIDYAVMEKTRDALVLPLDAGWSDVGSWSSLFDALPADEEGNVLQGDVLVHDTHDCYVHSTSRLVTAVGMDDHVIVETKDAVLVAPKDRVQDVKELVSAIKKAGRSESSLHREVFRPWGSYDSIDNGDRFQVKRLSVKPGGVLSLQMHHHRAEHWIVVQGTARITCNDKTFLLSENESTYIPIGATHRIENPGKVPLHIVEVQSGSYLGEDDIVRFEDSYGRKGTST
ncbi:MAG TPA: mannose-1-phosphate guanylyltransferase/mannose-6-phosphate isomerase [Steroidobacteraceae bacterium]|jgi:mannose-1-phosphate guanylyltransferase/mannose-6-phosphate isomerase|nr:mannose-1-phosphate guanylyltransferase/mannose-6-phosphate isomerase [Steroidobacteraceae bacterium]